MKNFTRKTSLELSFVLLLILGGYAIAKAQDQQSDKTKKVKIEVEVTENGSKSTTITEKQMDRDGVDQALNEMVEEIEFILEEAMNDMDDTDLEIIIRRNGNADEPRFRKHMMAVPDAALTWSTEIEQRAFLGVIAMEIEDDEAKELKIEKGARIEKMVEGSAAEKAGLMEGDILTLVDGVEVADFSDVARAIRANDPGEKIDIEFIREGKKKKISAELGQQQARAYAYHYNWDSDNPSVHAPHPPRPPRHEFGVPHFETIIRGDDRKAFLGIVGKSIDDYGGVQLQEIFEGSAAYEMGLKVGDVVHAINGNETKNIRNTYRN